MGWSVVNCECILDGGRHYYPEQTTINSDGYALPIMLLW